MRERELVRHIRTDRLALTTGDTDGGKIKVTPFDRQGAVEWWIAKECEKEVPMAPEPGTGPFAGRRYEDVQV